MTGQPTLIVAAFWSHDSTAEVMASVKSHALAGSGAVVDFTTKQVDQPGLRATLRRLQLEQAADYLPGVRVASRGAS